MPPDVFRIVGQSRAHRLRLHPGQLREPSVQSVDGQHDFAVCKTLPIEDRTERLHPFQARSVIGIDGPDRKLDHTRIEGLQ